VIYKTCVNEFGFNCCKRVVEELFFDKASQFMRNRTALLAYHFDNKFAAAFQAS
jgi:hypothetical protein